MPTDTTPSMERGAGIDPAVDRVRREVHRRLREVERDRNLRVLFACESGSRAWGFASNDSDFDVRFIYAYPVESYLRLNPPADAFDLHQDQDFDLAGWDIRKTCELLRKSNNALLEWLDSPIIYEADPEIAPRLIAMRQSCFCPKKSTYHYLSLAGGVFGKYIRDEPEPIRKKYLYVLRPLACIVYMQTHDAQPPTRFDDVLAAIDLPQDVADAVATLVADKKSDHELGRGPADTLLNAWVESTLTAGEAFAEAAEPRPLDTKPLDQLITDAVLRRTD
ncbi:MAG: nucleotidyltransferase domain-containing protein [Planctomycetota bacterium]